MAEKIDLAVIGGGSGGVRAARRAAAQGASVVLYEHGRLGGTCVNLGCVPKKLLSYASRFGEDFAEAAAYGWSIGNRPRLDWKKLRAAKDREIQRLNGVYLRALEEDGVQVVRQRAKLADAGRQDGPARVASADGDERDAGTVLIATGSAPQVPDIPGMREHACVSDDIFSLAELPERALVAGAGYIAVEFACILAGMGVRTTLLHRGPEVLKNFDSSVRRALLAELQRRGVTTRLNTQIEKVERRAGERRAICRAGPPELADLLLAATGRAPRTEDLGLAEAGVSTGRSGAIPVNDEYRSSAAAVFAVGDVIGRLALTPVAIAEAGRFAALRFGGAAPPVNYGLVPTAVFSSPQVGTVGLTEQQAREKHPDCEVFANEFTPMKQSLAGGGEKTVVKLICAAGGGAVLGAHMLGPEAGEIVQGIAVAMMCGATKRDFDATVGVHPTAAEEFVAMR